MCDVVYLAGGIYFSLDGWVGWVVGWFGRLGCWKVGYMKYVGGRMKLM